MKLNNEQRRYIADNYLKISNKKMAASLNVETDRVAAYRRSAKLKIPKQSLTEEQERFILENYETVSEKKMAVMMGFNSPYLIRQFKVENDISKIDKKEAEVIEGYFNVNSKQSWL